MGVAIHRFLGRFGVVVALSLAILATAACGGSSDSGDETTRATAEPAGTEANESTSATAATEPQGEIAPKFELPSGTGEAISLASFAGDKNVVLVFYRGFW